MGPLKNKKGQFHCEDGPAYIDVLGIQYWYFNGKRHRADGPATVSPVAERWYFHGKLHRLDGPAINSKTGFQAWYVNDKRHRTDGPAIVQPNGTHEWWLDGEPITTEVKKWMKAMGYRWRKDRPWKPDRVAEFLLTFSK
jgi:hypothetical protein